MKKIGIFFLGVIVGVFFSFFMAVVIVNNFNKFDNPYNISGLSMLPEKGKCIITSNINSIRTICSLLVIIAYYCIISSC